MEQYIPKSTLVAEIDRQKIGYNEIRNGILKRIKSKLEKRYEE